MISLYDPEVDAELLDGATAIHKLSPTSNGAKTFDEYATSIFVAYILRQLEKVSGLDVVYNGMGMSLSEGQKGNR